MLPGPTACAVCGQGPPPAMTPAPRGRPTVRTQSPPSARTAPRPRAKPSRAAEGSERTAGCGPLYGPCCGMYADSPSRGLMLTVRWDQETARGRADPGARRDRGPAGTDGGAVQPLASRGTLHPRSARPGHRRPWPAALAHRHVLGRAELGRRRRGIHLLASGRDVLLLGPGREPVRAAGHPGLRVDARLARHAWLSLDAGLARRGRPALAQLAWCAGLSRHSLLTVLARRDGRPWHT